MSGLRLGKRVLPKELYEYQRSRQVGMEGASFRLGKRILGEGVANPNAPKSAGAAKVKGAARLSVEKLEKALTKPNAQLVIQLAEEELDDAMGEPRLGALRALLTKAKLPGVRKDIRERLQAAIAEAEKVSEEPVGATAGAEA